LQILSQRLVTLINRLVEFLDSLSVLGTPERQRLIGELPELPNCLHQLVEGELPIFDAQAILYDPALALTLTSEPLARSNSICLYGPSLCHW
jgi:hypothetical protein